MIVSDILDSRAKFNVVTSWNSANYLKMDMMKRWKMYMFDYTEMKVSEKRPHYRKISLKCEQVGSLRDCNIKFYRNQ